MSSVATQKSVTDEYGKTYKKPEMKSGMCSNKPVKYPKYIVDVMKLVHEEVVKRNFGCGPVFAPAVKGAHILDLGAGTGRDCYILSKLVGESGSVTGLDTTDEQLEIAERHKDYHAKLFGYASPNVEFVKGNMEQMEAAGVPSNKFDVIVSNCTVNLAKDKLAVLREAARVLKEGGEFYFSDVYADRELPKAASELWYDCVSGVMYWKDLHKMAAELGFSVPRVVNSRLKDVERNESYRQHLGEIRFASITYSLFKMPKAKFETKSVTYQGGVEGFEDQLQFCHGITFNKGEVSKVQPELSTILQSSRYKKYFSFGDSNDGVRKCAKVDIDPFEVQATEYSGPGSAFPSCC